MRARPPFNTRMLIVLQTCVIALLIDLLVQRTSAMRAMDVAFGIIVGIMFGIIIEHSYPTE